MFIIQPQIFEADPVPDTWQPKIGTDADIVRTHILAGFSLVRRMQGFIVSREDPSVVEVYEPFGPSKPEKATAIHIEYCGPGNSPDYLLSAYATQGSNYAHLVALFDRSGKLREHQEAQVSRLIQDLTL